MLTYESIRKIIEEEKNSGKLCELPENFFREANLYLDKKTKLEKEDWKVESLRRRLQEIMELRERKVLNLALYSVRSGVAPENLTSEERTFFNAVLNNIKIFRSSIKKIMKPVESEELLVMLKDLDQFVGINMLTYGPFKAGDIVTLPKLNAELLVKKNVAEVMEINVK